MDSKKIIKYCVVQFLHKPYPNIDQYVIVPDSWIIPRGNRICVLYPDIGPSAKLFTFYGMDPYKNGNKIKWTPYLSEVKHTAKNYQDARNYIKKECSTTKIEPSSSKIEPTQPIFKKDRKRSHVKLAHCSSEPKVKKQQDIDSFSKMIAERLCKEFLPAFFQRSLSENQLEEEFLHTIAHVNDHDSDDENATEPTNKRASCEFRQENSGADSGGAVKPTKRRISFVLPPDYDENDPRWTLRHRELRPGLDKLLPEFEVYIDTRELNYILSVSSSALQLARLLCKKIFSDNALATCSLTGKAYGPDPRPGLNKDGRIALLKFVHHWVDRKQWDPIDENSVNAALRTVLRQRRRL